MKRWILGIVLLNVSVCCKAEDEIRQEPPVIGFRIEEKHVRVMNALADMLFSYGERHGDAEQIENERKELNSLVPENVLRVGVINNCLPFCTKRGDEFVGFEVDLVKLLAEQGDYPYQFLELSIEDALERLSQKKIDIIIGGHVKDAVSSEYTEGYLSVDLCAVALKKQATKKNFISSLMGKNIGVLTKSYGEQFVRDAHIQNATVTPFKDFKTLLSAVVQDSNDNNIDVAIIDHRTAQDWVVQHPELSYTLLNIKKELAFRFNADTPWKTTLDQGIKEVLGTQKFNELLERWSLGKF